MARCRVAGVDEQWLNLESVIGVIADLALERPNAIRCLRRLAARRGDRRIPLIYLTRTGTDAVLRETGNLGIMACFSALAIEPRTIVASLFRLIAPGKTTTDLLVEYNFELVGSLFSEIFAAARSGSLDMKTVDEAVGPLLAAVQEGGLNRWITLIQAHDDTTLRHCLLVAGYAAHFAIHLGLSSSERATMIRAGLIHDVGKALIPLSVLNKPGKLNSSEMATMRDHAALGHEILVAAGSADPIMLAVARHHHEMLDGSGYPDGLRGDQIGDTVRLLTICDIYAALTERRPYRPPMPQTEALQILRGMTGKLEPALVEAFAISIEGKAKRHEYIAATA
ncbi:HD-GYP domain-containing protein [Methylobacterium haplocladii]|nr:HD domain-containing phosphohydrolase [Methylobacterium haplocladii]GJD84738.1 putative cyclic di-GMP phosphodiesterase [Methylobacterium haplocladii]